MSGLGQRVGRKGEWRRIRNRGGSAARQVVARRLAEAQNWRCAYCHCHLDFGSVTIEHVHPLSLGGAHAWENMVAACEPCNAAMNAAWLRGMRPAAIPLSALGTLSEVWPA